MNTSTSQSSTAGWNMGDSIGAALNDIDDGIKAIGKDAFAGEVKPPLLGCLDALRVCREDHWTAADEVQSQLVRMPELLGGAADAAAAALPTSGWGSPQDLRGAQAQARAGVFRAAKAGATKAVLSTRSLPMMDHAAAAQAALQLASTEIAWCVTQWGGPSALSDDVTIEDLHRIASVEKQIKAQKTPMLYVLDYLKQAVENADKKTLALFTEAARTVALDFRDTPPAKLVQRYTVEQTASLDNERNRAFQVLRALDQVREKQQPPSLAAGTRILAAEIAVFGELCGFSPRLMTLEAAGSRLGKAENRFDIDNDFVSRYLPPKVDGPPGWSPMVYSETGRRVRAGKLKGA